MINAAGARSSALSGEARERTQVHAEGPGRLRRALLVLRGAPRARRALEHRRRGGRRRGARRRSPRGCGEIVLSRHRPRRLPRPGERRAWPISSGASTALPGLRPAAPLVDRAAPPHGGPARGARPPAGGAPPARAAAVGRRRRARRHGPALHAGASTARRVAAARGRLPGLAVSTDLIVGFPGEDEAAFARTLAAHRAPTASSGACTSSRTRGAAGHARRRRCRRCRRPRSRRAAGSRWRRRRRRAAPPPPPPWAPRPQVLRRGAPRRLLEGVQFDVRALLPRGRRRAAEAWSRRSATNSTATA